MCRFRVRLRLGSMRLREREYGRFVSATGHSSGTECWTYEDGEWKTRAGRNWRTPGYTQTDSDPAVCVSWEDAQSYVEWLSAETGEGYRLLSESEWEYAARAGTTGPFHFGSTISTDQANYDGNYIVWLRPQGCVSREDGTGWELSAEWLRAA